MQEYEKLATFYLGRLVGTEQEQASAPLLLYDAKDLTTHAMCVGMTGSGKTGLCIALLEEAAIDAIPAIVIDPKGDIGNLLLTFPDLHPSDFLPWIDEGEAARKGMTAEQYSAFMAETWRKGLGEWGQQPERIERLRNSADFAIYTPGSSAGLPLSILASFAAPKAGEGDVDGLRDRVSSTVSGLLALIGVTADPVQSREHILLSNLIEHFWIRGVDMDIAAIIHGILDPPFAMLGVFDLESLFPRKDRTVLAMKLNNILASPSFAAWMQGEPLDVDRLLFTDDGTPRISILSIAHLSDTERMFFVTLVLNHIIAWMRRQSGTSSLRAVLYMDEIFGFFPPSAEPPSKKPMLTLLKQARAFGLGCVLATQNPVDLDYKGLGNTGTWFIGRLQTERDKLRVLDGLESVSVSSGAKVNRREIDNILSGLDKRMFLMSNVHDDAPVVFQTRWVLSWLRGPLTRPEIERLMADRKSSSPQSDSQASPNAETDIQETVAMRETRVATRPVLPAHLTECFFLSERQMEKHEKLVYRPALLVTAKLHYIQARTTLDIWKTLSLLTSIPEASVEAPWDDSIRYADDAPPVTDNGIDGAEYGVLPSNVGNAATVNGWRRSVSAWLYRHECITMWRSPDLRSYSMPGESEKEYRVRISQLLHEQRDIDMEKLRNKYLPRFTRVQERIRRAEQAIEREEARGTQRNVSAAVDIGSTLLGAFLGRRTSIASAARRTTAQLERSGRVRQSVTRSKADLQAARSELSQLEDQFRTEAGALRSVDAKNLVVEELRIAPRKSDIDIVAMSIAWLPFTLDEAGTLHPCWERSGISEETYSVPFPQS